MQKNDIGKIIEIAKKTIIIEAESISNLVNFIDVKFAEVVEKIFESTGRVIITGIGKSANIGNKIVASFNSTGTPAIFMHAADAIHGDLGIVQKDDIVICLSKSGNTPEIKVLIPLIRNNGNLLVAIVGDENSFLAKSADYVLLTKVDSEACPNNLAPTSSTTAQLVMGDALMVALLQMRGFTTEDFARFHPGGSLGKKLYLRVDDIYVQNAMPKVKPKDNIKKVISEITSKRLGATAVVDENDMLLGIITDGDLRRMLEKFPSEFTNLNAKNIMSDKPKVVEKNCLAINALSIIRKNNISQIIVVNENKYLGIVHLHDLMREGIV
ncbi:MAG: KpsF/GutQ family sugar-phosphate isomerase [Bacteroidales bacterium]|jgi:arabinose-5-phosphate isomerase|nr:KpsF/GutQ family sugar-phosphate isomerase [Bacteroidales bacterium]MCK9499020.1 KpsF/GutQ family sugar-phosphate isomerase [Bacteroidales bacterium]MDY0315626.1 KpsF/GutQ family sugar-phosphate isomerase [Bacteroidales bacterium]NLB87233.1 KpsF/GutQ family sugar-phosphate isomerase [Bacteroidales bacterium]